MSFNYDGHEAQCAFYAMATVNIGPEITVIPGVRLSGLKGRIQGSASRTT